MKSLSKDWREVKKKTVLKSDFKVFESQTQDSFQRLDGRFQEVSELNQRFRNAKETWERQFSTAMAEIRELERRSVSKGELTNFENLDCATHAAQKSVEGIRLEWQWNSRENFVSGIWSDNQISRKTSDQSASPTRTCMKAGRRRSPFKHLPDGNRFIRSSDRHGRDRTLCHPHKSIARVTGTLHIPLPRMFQSRPPATPKVDRANIRFSFFLGEFSCCLNTLDTIAISSGIVVTCRFGRRMVFAMEKPGGCWGSCLRAHILWSWFCTRLESLLFCG
jgi:hypothetical protein